MRIAFLKISEIDTIKEQFNAEVFIEAKWSEPRLKIEVKKITHNLMCAYNLIKIQIEMVKLSFRHMYF